MIAKRLGLVFALTLSVVAQAAAPRREALVVGGGCESPDGRNKTAVVGGFGDQSGVGKGHYNLFRPEIQAAVGALSGNGWNTTVQYDGTEWERPWPQSGESSKKDLLAELAAKAKSLHEGDQFLLTIATHGDGGPHSICLGDGKLLEISALRPLLAAMLKNKVKVAVMDNSCYSGGTVDVFKGMKLCAMAGTSAYTTDAGDNVWLGLFSHGYKKGEKLPSYYNASGFTGSADLDGDGRVSAAEGFQFGRLHETEPVLPRTSDCRLSDSNLNRLLNDSALFFRNTLSVKPEDEDLTVRTGDKAICAMTALPAAFQKLYNAAEQSRRSALEDELRFMGFVGQSVPGLITSLGVKVSELRKLVAAIARAEDHADEYLAKAKDVPGATALTLREGSERAGRLKIEIFNDLRPLVQVACRIERLRAPVAAKTPCEDFDLLPANREAAK